MTTCATGETHTTRATAPPDLSEGPAVRSASADDPYEAAGPAGRARRTPGDSTAGPQRRSRQAATDDPYETARAIALRSLAMTDRTRAQLSALLARKGVEEHVATAVLDRLQDVRLIDDAAFAQKWVASRHEGRGLSRRAIGQELRHRGIAEELAAEALGPIDAATEEERARSLVASKLAATRGLDIAVRLRRLVGMLARKGYPPGLATRVTREALALEADVDAPERRFLDSLDGPLSDLARLGE